MLAVKTTLLHTDYKLRRLTVQFCYKKQFYCIILTTYG